jgi:hypothetical protein
MIILIIPMILCLAKVKQDKYQKRNLVSSQRKLPKLKKNLSSNHEIHLRDDIDKQS